MKIVIPISVDVTTHFPDDYPQEKIQEVVHNAMMDYCDGRYPFDAEMIVQGVENIINRHIKRCEQGRGLGEEVGSAYVMYWYESVDSVPEPGMDRDERYKLMAAELGLACKE